MGENWLKDVRALLGAGADPNAVSMIIDSGHEVLWTALHAASADGHSEVVRALLEAGAAVDALTNAGETPLQLARSRGHHGCVTVLEKATRGGTSN